jgi:hypothetical protein
MSIEKKKKQLELGKVTIARDEMEIRIEERKEEITRLKKNIVAQEERMEQLKAELAEM